MISFDFDYYSPKTVGEAITTFYNLEHQGKKTIYFAGGTEIITLARMNYVHFDYVLNISRLPECNVFEIQNDFLVIGSAITLTQLAENHIFPFMSDVVKHICDRTNRNKITLGGNIAGMMIYKEAVLPLLLTNSYVLIAGKKGMRIESIQKIFHNELKLDTGEFIVQFFIDKSDLELPFISIRRTKQSKVDYPLVHITSIRKNNQISFAFSGVCPFPFHSAEMENAMNDSNLSIHERIEKGIELLPAPIIDDIRGSKEYRRFVLMQVLEEIWMKWEEI